MDSTPRVEAWSQACLPRARRAIVVVDVVESVRLMQGREAEVIERWRRFVNEIRTQVLPAFEGRLVKSLGDGLLLEFERVPVAVACAAELHRRVARYNDERSPEAAIRLRIGAHVAEVVIDELDIYGVGVNLAARLGSLAGPDETVVSAEVRDELVPGLDAEPADLGLCWLKHLDEPVRAYRLGDAAPRRVPHSPLALRPCLAILPFSSVGEDGVGALGQLIADEVHALLEPSRYVALISRLSVAAIAGRQLPVGSLHRHLGADYAVLGEVGGGGGRTEVTVRLLHTHTGEQLAQHVVDCSTTAARQPGSGVALEIAAAISNAVLNREIERVRHLPLPNLEAHALLVGSVALMHKLSLADFLRARVLLDALEQRAPRHALPKAWLARWHVFRVVQGWSENLAEDRRRADDLVRRALDADPESPLAMTIAGSIAVGLRQDPEEARSLYDAALALNPQEPLAWLLRGTAHAFLGDGSQAMSDVRRAMALSPLDPMSFFFDAHAAGAALVAGDYAMAIAFAQRSLRANRLHTSTYRSLAIAQALSGQLDDARRTVAELLVREPGLTVERFLERSPGARYEHGQRFAQALRQAGLPALGPP